MAEKSNRRDFLKSSAGAAAMGFWVANQARGEDKPSKSPNEKLNVAHIGAGGMGASDVANIAATGKVNTVALCDVDENNAKGSFERFPKARRFQDFREMFDKMGKEIDAVSVSTPDHTHAVATMMAMKLGKHVYTQKPLTHDVYEARMLTEAAAKYGVVTQMGNQGTAEDGMRTAVEVIWSGAIGPVREVHVWTNRPVWPQGAGAILQHQGVQNALAGKIEPIAVPKTLNWDLWLGTAPERAYDPIYAPFKWRGWLDYGTGALGDMACHTANMAFMACKLGYPTSVKAEVSEWNGQTFPLWSVVEYEFPARGEMPPLKWTWYDGAKEKPAWVNEKLKKLAYGRDLSDSGSLIIGDKGTLFSPNDYGADFVMLPEKDFDGYKPPTPTLPRAPKDSGPPHWNEWVTACLKNDPKMPMSNFAYAGPLTETVVLGCVAMRAGKKIEWDGPNMTITNDKDANKFIKREYRKGWEL